jgi:hypothetical protein
MAKKQKKKKSKGTTLLITNKIYSRVCSELDTSVEKIREDEWMEMITPEEAQEAKEKLDTLYLKYICELDSDTLADVLDDFAGGTIKRAQRTIDIIQKELLERVMNEDNKDHTD